VRIHYIHVKLSSLLASFKPELPQEYVESLFIQMKQALKPTEQIAFQKLIDSYEYRFEPCKLKDRDLKKFSKRNDALRNSGSPRRSL
jgi:hypothetical protein